MCRAGCCGGSRGPRVGSAYAATREVPLISRIRTRLTYANVAATLALVFAITGGAYAAIQLPKDSVGAKQLKRNAVRSAKVKNGSLLAKDFKAGQLPAGARGPQGPKGEMGPQGELG